MTKDEIQFWMLIAFAIAFVLSSYKVYFLFSTPLEGVDTQTQHNQLEDIIIDFIKELKNSELTSTELFNQLKTLDSLQDTPYKNFNENRFNQLLQKLFYTYKVQTLNELIISIHQTVRGTSNENDL